MKKTSVLLLVASVLAMPSFAIDYFVAPNGVDDTFDGLGRSSERPYQTIGYALAQAKTRDDRVYVAEGTYRERNLVVAAGVGLIATGRRDLTVIDAEAGDGDPARCIQSLAAKAYVKGFTIRNGRLLIDSDNANNHGGGVKADATAAIIDCAIRNCQGYRGGGGNGGIWIRCYFSSDNYAKFHKCASGVYGAAFAANCVFDGVGCLTSSPGKKIVNCTFMQSAPVGTNTTGAHPLVYNSIVADILNSLVLTNSVAYMKAGTESSILDKDESCIFSPAVIESSPSIARDSNFNPLQTATNLVNRGIWSYYADAFPEDWKEIGEWMKCYGGGIRKAGAGIDIGAGEFSIRNIAGLKIETEDLGDGTSRLSVSQDQSSVHYLSGFTCDGETLSFDANAPGWTWTKIFTGDLDLLPFLPSPADENCYYVDGANGDDSDTGIGRFHAFKTIQAAMDAVAARGTIRVMPGVYRYGPSCRADGEGISNVVFFTKENVKMIGVRGAKRTIIEGNPVKTAEGVRCVNASKSGSFVQGFTLRNGGTYTATDVKGNGGCLLGGTAVDCIFTGGRAGGRGGAAYNSTLVRCFAEDCSNGAGTGSGMEGGKLYGSVFKGLTYYGSTGSIAVNCTFIGQGLWGSINGNKDRIPSYNCLLIGGNSSAGNSGADFHNSVLVGGGLKAGVDLADDDCKINVDAAEYAIDPTTFRPVAGSKLIDAGSDAYYEDYYGSAFKDEYLDFAGGARIVGEAIDIGAGERSAEAERLSELSQTLATDGRVTVTEAGADVTVTAAGAVSLPADSRLKFTWEFPFDTPVAANYRYTVELAPGAKLVFREFGEVVREISASGVYSFLSPYGHGFVVEAVGGTAQLSALHNTVILEIVDANARMSVTGASVGVTELSKDDRFTVTFARDGYIKPLLAGVLVNGEFRSFSGADADVEQVVSIDGLGENMRVEAVYSVTNHWYVDAVRGNDDNDGFTPYRARKTLVAAMALATTPGDVVHAAPGVYSNGIERTSGETDNRVEVAELCGLVADEGAAVTVIEGRWDSGDEWGCGSEAIRCALLRPGAWIRGFTLRNGATAKVDEYGECGGGIFQKASTCAAIDCIVENCRAVRGGGVASGNYVRCLLRGNDSSNRAYPGLGSYNGEGYYDCVFLDAAVYGQIGRIVNCSFIGSKLTGNLTWPHVYNSYVATDGGKCHYHNCVYGSRTTFTDSSNNSTFDDDCVQAFNAAVAVDAAFRPLATATALVDRGRFDYSAENRPAAWPGVMDITGGQRVYHAAIDIGAGECDWRPVFAKRLVGGRGEIRAASPGVVEGPSGVLLRGDESLSIDWTATRAGEQSFAATVTGAGVLTVRLNGVPLMPTEGVYAFESGVGETSHLELSFAGTGSAEILKFCSPRTGLIILVK